MSTTLLERFRKNVEAKKDESEFLDASIEKISRRILVTSVVS